MSGLCTHSYSPYLESKVPACKLCSFKVNRGPHSWSLAITPFLVTVLGALFLWFLATIITGNYWSLLLHLLLLKYISVMPEEDKIPLVVKCHCSPTPKLRVLRKYRSQQSPNSMPKSGGEVVQKKLRHMPCRFPMTLNPLTKLNTGELEMCSRSFRQIHYKQPIRILPVLIHDELLAQYLTFRWAGSSLYHQPTRTILLP